MRQRKNNWLLYRVLCFIAMRIVLVLVLVLFAIVGVSASLS